MEKRKTHTQNEENKLQYLFTMFFFLLQDLHL